MLPSNADENQGKNLYYATIVHKFYQQVAD